MTKEISQNVKDALEKGREALKIKNEINKKEKKPTKKLTKNRLYNNMREFMESQDFNPILELIELYKNSEKERIQLEALTELCQYYAPKLKHIEIEGKKDAPVLFNLNLGELDNVEKDKIINEIEEKNGKGVTIDGTSIEIRQSN